MRARTSLFNRDTDPSCCSPSSMMAITLCPSTLVSLVFIAGMVVADYGVEWKEKEESERKGDVI